MATTTPEVLWAQRSSKTDAAKNYVYLTISVPDVPPSGLKLDLQPTGLSFNGHSGTLKKDYCVALNFFAEIDVAESKIIHTPKNVEIVLRKKELKDEYWPRLTKESTKYHFLKTDFDKWVDEDEQDEAPEDDLGGMARAPGMGDMSSMMGGQDFGGIDFSKLGGGGSEEPEDEDDEDEQLPELEGEEDGDGSKISTNEADTSSSTATPKIQEV